MSAAALLCIWLAPLLALPFASNRLGKWLLVLAPLPALFIALFAMSSMFPSGDALRIPWLLLGVTWGLDETGRIFLLISSLLWLIAALYAVSKPAVELQTGRYRIFFLLSMTGNLGLIIAQDVISFYLGFALMGLSAYGMTKPSRSQSARYAARLYLSMTILGEMALFTAIVLLIAQADALEFDHLQGIAFSSAPVLLLIIGFGIKIGLPGLHLWMPLTYISAPTATVAVMCSSMLNAGLLGLLRFLPPGNESLFGWAEAIIVYGLVATFYGILIGLLQNSPRSVLAYSSISKMGTLTTGIGLALYSPQAAPLLTVAVVLYASHHALVKSALFLGTDLFSQRKSQWIFLSLCFLALALAGAPLTSGAAAKVLLKDAIPSAWVSLTQWLVVAGLATVLLMGRFLFLVWNKSVNVSGAPAGIAKAAYIILCFIIAAMPVMLAPMDKLLSGAFPVVTGVALIAVVWLSYPRILRNLRIDVPPGDVLVVLSWLFVQAKDKSQQLFSHFNRMVDHWNRNIARIDQQLKSHSSWSIEIMLRHWELAGVLWLALCLGLIAVLM